VDLWEGAQGIARAGRSRQALHLLLPDALQLHFVTAAKSALAIRPEPAVHRSVKMPPIVADVYWAKRLELLGNYAHQARFWGEFLRSILLNTGTA
jgi:hypothetical protein